MIIYGAGLTGLLAGNIFRSFNPDICEDKNDLPNSHGALLRFRTDKVGTACAIPFKKVRVNKVIKYDGRVFSEPNIFFSNMYSQKVTGSIMNRSINDLSPSDRYIAPFNLVKSMAENCRIKYSNSLTIDKIKNSSEPIISTIPMPDLMKIVGWKEIPEFYKQKIYTQRARIAGIKCDIYQTIYYPDPNVPHYRVSVIGDLVISESISKPVTNAGQNIIGVLINDFGFNPKKLVDIEELSQEYGKILPVDNRLRKEFIFQMTTKYNIYSVGRFATWRQILMDDIVNDLQVIEEFIRGGTDYTRWMYSQKGEKNES
jgi:hypothetical protein